MVSFKIIVCGKINYDIYNEYLHNEIEQKVFEHDKGIQLIYYIMH